MRIWLLLLALLTPVTAQSHLSVTGPAAVELYELAPMAPPAPIIKARSAVLVDLDSGKTLYQLDPHGRHAPASLTKIVTSLVLNRLTGGKPLRGFILDGFPRSLQQAEDSYEWGQGRGLTFHKVISLAVDEDELVRRLLDRGRRSRRSDDNEETIRKRLRVYDETTRPLLDFYRQRSILAEIDGTGPVDEVTDRIRAALDPVAESD